MLTKGPKAPVRGAKEVKTNRRVLEGKSVPAKPARRRDRPAASHRVALGATTRGSHAVKVDLDRPAASPPVALGAMTRSSYAAKVDLNRPVASHPIAPGAMTTSRHVVKVRLDQRVGPGLRVHMRDLMVKRRRMVNIRKIVSTRVPRKEGKVRWVGTDPAKKSDKTSGSQVRQQGKGTPASHQQETLDETLEGLSAQIDSLPMSEVSDALNGTPRKPQPVAPAAAPKTVVPTTPSKASQKAKANCANNIPLEENVKQAKWDQMQADLDLAVHEDGQQAGLRVAPKL